MSKISQILIVTPNPVHCSNLAHHLGRAAQQLKSSICPLPCVRNTPAMQAVHACAHRAPTTTTPDRSYTQRREGRNLGHRARQDLVQVIWPGTAGWECSCSVSEVFWTGFFTANKTCKVFQEFRALGRMMHNHLMPQNRLAPALDQKQLWKCTAWSPD